MTIYALSSGPGLSGLAVIRVSGEGALNIIPVSYTHLRAHET